MTGGLLTSRRSPRTSATFVATSGGTTRTSRSTGASSTPRACPAAESGLRVALTEAYDQLAALEKSQRTLGLRPVTADLLMDAAELDKIRDLLWERKQVFFRVTAASPVDFA